MVNELCDRLHQCVNDMERFKADKMQGAEKEPLSLAKERGFREA